MVAPDGDLAVVQNSYARYSDSVFILFYFFFYRNSCQCFIRILLGRTSWANSSLPCRPWLDIRKQGGSICGPTVRGSGPKSGQSQEREPLRERPRLVTIHEPRLQACADHPRQGILAIHPVSQKVSAFPIRRHPTFCGPGTMGNLAAIANP